MVEIERKYLVKDISYREVAISRKRIVQGFLNTDPDRTVRVRIKGDEGFLTVKGISNASGTTRFEWETGIKVEEAEALLQLCEPSVIDKTRYEIPMGKYLFEVDEFHGDNEGLIIAEIELDNENDFFERPDWLGEEVTGDIKYYNSQLSKNPFTGW
ncbi:CYTH domain-containing protein [Maribacter sp. TH_r10]|uniref:CYTH domain-containing protein n=1 Tax=Maribacter luteus TaxID=2594478 RepID=A0A6I2MGW4_9FLAO|nr:MULTISPECIES: CYTH domain-containing protein [Maribacter]MDV7137795.1 CYTH domain-containing protein [Maribacter sp. TH_r10]MRX63043.1 CYTH domain-containing protein [Maribacter luteus]|tara:strand:+ start:111 stop:578 length:468 start_codon:yes stop_codon:yes gene_type:complete